MKKFIVSEGHGLVRLSRIAYFLGIFGFTLTSFAQVPVSVPLDESSYHIESKHLAIFKDSSQSLTIDQIIEEVPPVKWEVPRLQNPSLADFESNYWVKIEFEGTVFQQKEWFIESLVSHTDHEKFYYKTKQGLRGESNMSGRKHPFASKSYSYKNFIYDLPKEEHFTAYFLVKGDIPFHMIYKIRTKKNFISFSLSEYFYLALFYGALIILGIYGFINYISLERRVYLLFFFHVLASIAFFTIEDGLGFQFLWPKSPWVNSLLFDWAPLLFLASLAGYVGEFFDVKEENPAFYKWSKRIVVFILVYNACEFLLWGRYSNITWHILPFSLFLSYAIYRANKGYTPGFLFVLGFSFTYVGWILLIERKYVWLDINWAEIYLVYSMYFGVLLELLLLALAMSLQIRYEKENQYQRLKDAYGMLKQKNSALSASMRSNTELQGLAYHITHDLRQPLINIKSFSDLLSNSLSKSDMLSKKQENMLFFIQDSAHRMDRLINGMLDYAKIGGEEKREEFYLDEIIEASKQNLFKQISESSAHISYVGCHLLYTGAYVKFVQLFQNLLSNSIKFAQEGVAPKIIIEAELNESTLTLKFQDNGIGIQPEYLPYIFDILYKRHPSTQTNGYGIGLAACKKIVESYHGEIWVESSPGQGSIFYITLPFS